MIWHEHEFIEMENSTVTIAKERVKEEPCCTLRAEDVSSLPSHSRDEECAVSEEVHATAAQSCVLSRRFRTAEAVRFHGRAISRIVS